MSERRAGSPGLRTVIRRMAEELGVHHEALWDILIPARAGYLAGVSPHYDGIQLDHLAEEAKRPHTRRLSTPP